MALIRDVSSAPYPSHPTRSAMKGRSSLHCTCMDGRVKTAMAMVLLGSE